jgi:hypothetical protein
MKKNYDLSSIIVISVTFILFLIALFTKGLTHDILLEAGVLLVSIKLIIMAFRTETFYRDILKEVKRLNDCLKSNN